jgi:hypothetical protein
MYYDHCALSNCLFLSKDKYIHVISLYPSRKHIKQNSTILQTLPENRYAFVAAKCADFSSNFRKYFAHCTASQINQQCAVNERRMQTKQTVATMEITKNNVFTVTYKLTYLILTAKIADEPYQIVACSIRAPNPAPNMNLDRTPPKTLKLPKESEKRW